MKKPITLISIISGTLFILAIFWFGLGIYTESKSAPDKAKNRYETLLFATKSAATKFQSGTPEFSNSFINAIGDINDFSSLKLDINGVTVYSYPPVLFSLPSPELVKNFSETVYTPQGIELTLTASIYLMKPDSIYNHAKLSFILILCGTIISVCLLLFLSEKDKNISERTVKVIKNPANDIFENDSSSSDDIAEESSPETEEKVEIEENPEEAHFSEDKSPETETQAEDVSDEEKTISDKDDVQKEPEEPVSQEESVLPPESDLAETENQPLEFENIEENAFEDSDGLDIIDEFEKSNAEFPMDLLEPPIFKEPEIEKKVDQNGLYNSAELAKAVDKAISESVESNKDMTLSIIKAKKLPKTNYISSKIVEIIKDWFADSEFFNYDAESYAIISKNTDLNSAVSACDNILEKISVMLKDNNAKVEIKIGVSSMTFRNIDSSRLILEADQAVVHAEDDPDSPIVAFRANPEKYKEFLKNN